MIQQASLKLNCQQDDHQDEIDFICYHEFCTGFRLNCFDCFKKGIHQSHFDDVKKMRTLIPFLESKNTECDNLIENLDKYIESVNQSFSQLKRGIRNKYSLIKERLVNLNSYQINDYLNSTIKLTEYKQSISTIIQEQTKKITHSFNNLYEQLSLYLNKQLNVNYFIRTRYHLIIIIKLMRMILNYLKISTNKAINYMLCLQQLNIYLDHKYNEALEQLDKSILMHPNNQKALSYKGSCLLNISLLDQNKVVKQILECNYLFGQSLSY